MGIFLFIGSLSKVGKMSYFRYVEILGGYIVCYLFILDWLEDGSCKCFYFF